ncbi:MAG: hypothetical protein Q8K02_00580, partial [Flavobacterium sp.]|nr:hypothetical protein [Flavobacterium sp.]
TCYMIDEHLQVVDIKRGAAQPELRTPIKKAIEMNYNVFEERLSLITSPDAIKKTILAKQ